MNKGQPANSTMNIYGIRVFLCVFLVVSCEEPDPLHHGNITVASHVFGSIANLSCADGYELDGNDTIECLSDGNWTTSNATCVSEYPYHFQNSNSNSTCSVAKGTFDQLFSPINLQSLAIISYCTISVRLLDR